jgi:DNA-binding protein YbaB
MAAGRSSDRVPGRWTNLSTLIGIAASWPEVTMVDRPNWASLYAVVDDLKRAVGSLGETQRKLAHVTGTGRSADRLVTVTVGPRGQLVDLEIDPRVFRNPDARGLADAILAAARAAVEDANVKTMSVVDGTVPAELRSGPFGGDDTLGALINRHDADMATEGGDDG